MWIVWNLFYTTCYKLVLLPHWWTLDLDHSLYALGLLVCSISGKFHEPLSKLVCQAVQQSQHICWSSQSSLGYIDHHLLSSSEDQWDPYPPCTRLQDGQVSNAGLTLLWWPSALTLNHRFPCQRSTSGLASRPYLNCLLLPSASTNSEESCPYKDQVGYRAN